MGYKLAGFDVLGGVEIDPKMMELYKTNHNPKHFYLMGVQDFKNIPDDQLPEELFNLDILDGSPPCSSFSMAGSREKAWGDEKKFREGQALQVLDDLFFHFIDIAKKLQPRIVVAENVKGLIMGNARGYVKQIFEAFKVAGYETQLFLLDSSFMGVPQKRQRTFFIARRFDQKITEFEMSFNEPVISTFKAIKDIDISDQKITVLTEETKQLWKKIMPGENLSKVHPKGHRFNECKINPNIPSRTINATGAPMHWLEPRRLCAPELTRLQSFPDDYNFLTQSAGYVCGMSVPPLMMQRISAVLAEKLITN